MTYLTDSFTFCFSFSAAPGHACANLVDLVIQVGLRKWLFSPYRWCNSAKKNAKSRSFKNLSKILTTCIWKVEGFLCFVFLLSDGQHSSSHRRRSWLSDGGETADGVWSFSGDWKRGMILVCFRSFEQTQVLVREKEMKTVLTFRKRIFWVYTSLK